MLAGALPEAAVKAVTCTEKVCPGRKTEAAVLPIKEFVGVVSPLLSIRKGLGLTSVAFTGALIRLELMMLPEVASTTSLATRENWVDEDGVAVTMPSTQSPELVASGSYSSKVKVPSALRAMSKLATWPCTTQAAKVKVVQLGEKTVEELATAVREPRVAGCTVTDCVVALMAVTVPVTSSTKSS